MPKNSAMWVCKVGLQAGNAVNVIVDSQAVLVKSDVASAQIVRDKEERRAAQQARASRSANPGELPGVSDTGAGGGCNINGGHDDHPDTSSGKSYEGYGPAARSVHQPSTEYAPGETRIARNSWMMLVTIQRFGVPEHLAIGLRLTER
jgi:hypothetical protein